MRTATEQSIRPESRSLRGVFVAIAALVLMLVAPLAPSASAETPAERCRRETSTYNAAWAAIGKKPPVPYKCGGSNEPPPPLPPTTSEERPDKAGEPTTDSPETGSQYDGPSMTAPTERREIDHPGEGQPTIGKIPEPTRPSSTDEPETEDTPSQPDARRPARPEVEGRFAKVPAVPSSVFKNTVGYSRSGSCTGDTYQADDTKWGMLAEGYFTLQYCYGYFDDGNVYYNDITGSVQTSDGLLDKVTYTQGPVDGARNGFRSDMIYWSDGNQGYEAYYFVGIKTCTLFKWAVCPGRNDYYAVGRMSTQGVSWRDGSQ